MSSPLPPTSASPKARALAAAGQWLARARADRDSLSVSEAARLAYRPGGPSIEDLELLIRTQRTNARTKTSNTAA